MTTNVVRRWLRASARADADVRESVVEAFERSAGDIGVRRPTLAEPLSQDIEVVMQKLSSGYYRTLQEAEADAVAALAAIEVERAALADVKAKLSRIHQEAEDG